jgi:hypothetical protein
MEARQRISLYSYPYLKLAKTPCFSYYLLHFSNKIGEQEGGNEMAQIMCRHVSKYKSDKIKFKNKKEKQLGKGDHACS